MTSVRHLAARILSALLAVSVTPLMSATELVHLGQPVRARNIVEGLVTKSRQTGRDVAVLSNNNEGSGMELIFVDLEDGTGTVLRAPAGAGAEALTELPGDRLAVGTFYDGAVMIFDLESMAFTKELHFPGEEYIWGFAIGSDGRAYFGSYPGGKLGALDLEDYTLHDLGAAAPPNLYLRSLTALPGGRILCRYIVEEPAWKVFDPATGLYSSVPEAVRLLRFPAVWNGLLIVGDQAFDPIDFSPVEPRPFPLPPSRERPVRRVEHDSEWVVDPFLTNTKQLYFKKGNALWRYDTDKQLTLVTAQDLRGGRLLAPLSDGRLVGVRGQDYFVMGPGDTTLDPRPIPGDSAPRSIGFLRADPQGRIWGGPPYGQTLFWMNPDTREVVNTRNISDSGGEVYEVAFHDGKVYAAAYSGGEVIRYDPEADWDQWNQSNPRTLSAIGPEFIRPTGGIIVGPDGKIWAGWTAKHGVYGGAVSVTDPATEQTVVIANPLGEQQVMGLATDGEMIYVGTGLGASGLGWKPDESSRIGILDPATRKVVWRQDIEGAKRVRLVGFDKATGVIPAIVDAKVRLFDVATRTFLDRAEDAPPVGSWSNALPGDGKLYYGAGFQVVVLDLASGVSQQLVSTPGPVNNVTAGPDGTIYFGVGVDLYEICE